MARKQKSRLWTIAAISDRYQCHRTCVWKKAKKLGVGTHIGNLMLFTDAEAELLRPSLGPDERAFRSAKIREGLLNR